ncbi:hypothetical protein [Pseudomonas bubulae]|uniref:hypothetical protein n=1 Tax=Pseudomonas bubulae TaxID=2316085 RepID=UPI00309C0B7C
MQRSEQPHIELNKAGVAINDMKASQSLEAMEESWKSYLHRIERTWNRVLHHYGKSPKWNGWQSNVLKQRKSDPLLSYLINARGCDEHTGEDIVTRTPGGIGIGTTDGGPLYIESLTINNGHVSFKGSSNARFDFISASVELKSIVNRGREYHPPLEHLGKPIRSKTMIHVAELGYDFYSGFIENVERHFVK